jgi:hypothetical protein
MLCSRCKVWKNCCSTDDKFMRSFVNKQIVPFLRLINDKFMHLFYNQQIASSFLLAMTVHR